MCRATMTTSLSGVVRCPRLRLATAKLNTEFEVSTSTSYEEKKGDTKEKTEWFVLAVSHSRSPRSVQ